MRRADVAYHDAVARVDEPFQPRHRRRTALRLQPGDVRARPELIVTGVVGAYLALLARWLGETETHTPQEMDAAFRHLVLPGVTTAVSGARR